MQVDIDDAGEHGLQSQRQIHSLQRYFGPTTTVQVAYLHGSHSQTSYKANNQAIHFFLSLQKYLRQILKESANPKCDEKDDYRRQSPGNLQ